MINSIIGKYKISRLIGEGGMASVYEAEHEMLGTKVAIKVLNPILSANAQIRERFKNEAKMMASFNHPNITKIIDFDDQPHQLSIVMEFLEGEDLNDKIKRNGPLNQQEIKDIFVQTLSAFQYAHDKGIVHRDIKPSNIYILSDGTVKILDFGIAKIFGEGNEMTQTGTQIGTPIYMSPEQIKADKTIDHRSDIYSLGVTMFYAVNGKPPYDSNTTSQFDIFSKIVYEALPELAGSGKFNDLIKKACSKDRNERFKECKEWLAALKGNETSASSNHTVMENTGSEKTIVESPGTDKTIVETAPGSNTEKTAIETPINQVSNASNELKKKANIQSEIQTKNLTEKFREGFLTRNNNRASKILRFVNLLIVISLIVSCINGIWRIVEIHRHPRFYFNPEFPEFDYLFVYCVESSKNIIQLLTIILVIDIVFVIKRKYKFLTIIKNLVTISSIIACSAGIFAHLASDAFQILFGSCAFLGIFLFFATIYQFIVLFKKR